MAIEYPVQLNADNVMCRVIRNREWVRISFTDLTEKEQKEILEKADPAMICKALTAIIRKGAQGK